MSEIAPLLPYFLQYGYLALFIIMYLSAAYLPLPANLALIAAGALSHYSAGGVHFNIFIAAIVALAGNVFGDLTGYAIARKFGNDSRKEKFEKKHRHFRKLATYLKEHPYVTIGITRLIGFISPIVNTIAGFTKLNSGVFIASDVVGNVAYTVLYIGAGYLIGTESGDTSLFLGAVTGSIVLIGIIYGIALFFFRDSD